MKKIIHIVGARPNFVKAAPLIKELNKHSVINLVVHTGQHYDKNMSQQFFDDLDLPKPDFNLGVGSGTHATQTSNVMIKCEQLFEEQKPDLVIVYGDINSCVAAALVAKKQQIKVAHVESGLRSFDNTMPEEINRIITDSISDILFVTSRNGLHNLNNQGIDSKKCHFVGNTMIDSLVEFEKKFDQSTVLGKYCLAKKEYALITFHRPSNVDSKDTLIQMFKSLKAVARQVQCVFPIHPRTRASLIKYNLYDAYNSLEGMKIIEPQGYIDFMCLQKNAKVLLTDSGGIQEESSFFQVPCLTIRDNTERPVTITHGTNILVGTRYDKIPSYLEKIDMLNQSDGIELWDGKSSTRIAKVISRELGL